MPLPINFDSILDGNKIESERVEFKETWDPQASLKTICAFANDLNNWGGGYLVIGVHETESGIKELMGVSPEDADKWMKDILNKCKLISPDYMPISEVVEREGKIFIVLWCPGGSTRPYSSPKLMGKKSERVQWVRRLSSTVVPSQAEQLDLYTLANQVPFDDRPNHNAELADLNDMLIKSYLKEVGSALYDNAHLMDFEEVCRNMHIVAGPLEHPVPLNVGLLFFSDNPDKFFPYAQIDIVEFPDGEGGDVLYEHTFKGPLHQQLANALRYLTGNVIYQIIAKHVDGSPSERFYNYPPEALREALANAVYHKGYDSREPIEVRVLPDRIEILSHPGADRSISREGLQNYRMACRRYRNRRIGEFLKELGLTEGRNTGVHKILRALRENGSPDPLFETDEDRLYFMITLYAHTGEVQKEESETRVISYDSPQARRAVVLETLAKDETVTIAQLGRALGIPVATLNRDIAYLKKNGALSREGRLGPWRVHR